VSSRSFIDSNVKAVWCSARLLGGLRAQLDPRLARGERTEVHEGDPVVLVVVGDEAQVLVLVDHAAAEDGTVPVAHRGNPVGLEHDVGKLGGRHVGSSYTPR
jgi:hypothetical protein